MMSISCRTPVFDGCEDAAPDGLPVNDAEPHLDEVEGEALWKIRATTRRIHTDIGTTEDAFFNTDLDSA